jgi:hypothetical protein
MPNPDCHLFPNRATIGLPSDWCDMEYRGKTYSIVQGVSSSSWKWTVQLDDKTVKFGEATSKDAAWREVVALVDKALGASS